MIFKSTCRCRWLAAFVLSGVLLAPHAASAQITLPYFESFEGTGGATYTVNTPSIAGAPEWSYENTDPAGRLRFAAGPDYPRTGLYAATMDRNPGGNQQVNYLTVTLDMTNYTVAADVIYLRFALLNNGEENDPADLVWVRGSNADPWIPIIDLIAVAGPPGVYVDVPEVDISAALAGAGQEYSTTFQVRFGQEDTTASTSISGIDGFTFDDISIRRRENLDTSVTAVLEPSEGVCGESAHDIVVEVTNLGYLDATDIPVSVDVTGAFTGNFAGTIPGPLAPLASTTITLGPLDMSAGGAATFTASSNLMGDQNLLNDTHVTTINLSPVPVPVDPAWPVCPGRSVDVQVNAEPDTTYEWYDVDTGGAPIFTGNIFPAPPDMMSRTYYVQRADRTEQIGPADNLIGNGTYLANFAQGLAFDVQAEVVIDVVHVYPESTGNVRVNLYDRLNNLIVSRAFNVNVPGVKTALPLNYTVPPGTGYTLTAESSTVTGLYRNSTGATYPYGGTDLQITGTINELPDYFYFFYDWTVTSANICNEYRTPFTVDPDQTACQTDLSLIKTATPMAVAGTEIDYTITIRNNGLDAASDVVVDDPTPPGLTFVRTTGACVTSFPCTLGAMGPATQRVINATYLIDPGYFPGSVLENTATVANNGVESESNPGDESDTAQSTIYAAADLSISMAGSPDPVLRGEIVTYQITVQNSGPSAAAGVVVNVELPEYVTPIDTSGCAEDPAGTPLCTVGALDVGESRDISIDARVDSAAATIRATAIVGSSATEDNPGDETATVDTGVTAATDLSIFMRGEPYPVDEGMTITYTIDVTNNGPSSAENVVVTDELPAGLTLIDTTGCEEDPAGVSTCSLGVLSVGQTARVVINATVDTGESPLVNTASVTTTTTQINEGDESFTVTIDVNAKPESSGCCQTGSTPPSRNGALLLLGLVAALVLRRRKSATAEPPP